MTVPTPTPDAGPAVRVRYASNRNDASIFVFGSTSGWHDTLPARESEGSVRVCIPPIHRGAADRLFISTLVEGSCNGVLEPALDVVITAVDVELDPGCPSR